MIILVVFIGAGRVAFDVFEERVVGGMGERWALFLGRLALVLPQHLMSLRLWFLFSFGNTRIEQDGSRGVGKGVAEEEEASLVDQLGRIC